MRYRAAAADALVIMPLDVLTAVFHRPSGQTHLLAEPAPELLAILAEPASLDELAERLRARFDMAALDRAALAARLDELITCGLVARI